MIQPRIRCVVAFAALLVLVSAGSAAAQQPRCRSRWDELTASDWPKAMERSNQTCILPIGILEKHGLHAPLGSDLVKVRELAARATKQEYAVVFPDYFYGQIYEAKHQPGTFALPSRLVWDLLDATVEEIGRNGFKKIVIINGHGGNPNLLRYFAQAQLERRRSYAVYFFDPAHRSRPGREGPAGAQVGSGRRPARRRERDLRPALPAPRPRAAGPGQERVGGQPEAAGHPNVYTGIWWFASYPNHYAGQAEVATRELGQLIIEHNIQTLVSTLRAIKADKKTLELQKEFFDRVDRLGK